MKSLMLFLQSVLADAGTWCDTSTMRDYKTIAHRVEHEGLSFLTITLSDFGSDFQKSLDQGHVGHDQFVSFSRSGGLPRFLGGFLDHVFDRGSGRLLDQPCIDCIHSIRQITLMFGKINLPCTKTRVDRAIRGYIKCEQDVKLADASLNMSRKTQFRRIGVMLWADVFSTVDRKVYDGTLKPKHGSGSVADKLHGNMKWNQLTWTERLDSIFPAGEYLLPNWRYQNHLAGITFLEPGAEIPVKVITVPKTLKTPRIIAMEPTCMQYMQQAVLREIVEAVQQDDICRTLIGWQSNLPNQELACQGSLNQDLATLDMSEASDRVSNQHVRMLLANHPHLGEAVDACRSRKADVDGYGVQRLAKFASMGSALTFPFESMVFMTLIFMGIEDELKRQITRKDIKSYLGRVRVYGDDIIIPVDFVEPVTRVLETFGLKVNRDKSFWTGKFRESCGKEYYSGVDVSIVRVRSLLPTHRSDASEIVSTISLRNQLYKSGFWKSAAHLDNLIREIVPFPVVADTSPLLGRFSYLGYETQRTDRHLHRPLVKGVLVSDTIPDSVLDGIGALLKIFTIHGDLPIDDVKHLKFAGRPRSVSIKTRWSTPY